LSENLRFRPSLIEVLAEEDNKFRRTFGQSEMTSKPPPVAGVSTERPSSYEVMEQQLAKPAMQGSDRTPELTSARAITIAENYAASLECDDQANPTRLSQSQPQHGSGASASDTSMHSMSRNSPARPTSAPETHTDDSSGTVDSSAQSSDGAGSEAMRSELPALAPTPVAPSLEKDTVPSPGQQLPDASTEIGSEVSSTVRNGTHAAPSLPML
jgi:hypothetical protein